MKKLITLFIVSATILSFTFSGCKKDPFKPGEDNDSHPILWQYKYDQHQISSDVIPAMDEKGNIFFPIQNGERQKDVYVFAVDKNGNALWDKHYSSTNYVDLSRVMYIDNKVIYVVTVYDDLYEYQETIYCLNANNGSLLWDYSPNYKTEKIITAMSATQKYLVVAAKWGGKYPDINELHFFDITSGNLLKSVDLGDDNVKLISILENSIYLGVASVDLGDFYAPTLKKMNLETNEILWTYHPDYDIGDVNYVFEQRSLPIDANGRIFCVIRIEHSSSSSNIYIVNSDGTLATTIPVPMHNAGNIYNILIDKDNNFYTAIHTFAKYSPSGNQIWEFYTGTTVPNSNFRTGCILADNDTVYHAETGGILNVNTIGEIAWAKYNETNFTNPGYPLLTNDGNMVVVGNTFVSCIKGDGAKIQNAPWPRVYQNNGNTASR